METKTKQILIGGVTIAAAAAVLLNALRSTIPKGALPVKPFDVKRYSGKWYEIARLDYKYEKGLSNATANYTLNDDGTIRVVNRGYDEKNSKWGESAGTAKFADKPDEARLLVTFFKPFYAGYNVIAIDPDYQYALVAGENLKYLWILSRQSSIPENVKQDYLSKAKNLGYDTAALVWTKHDRV